MNATVSGSASADVNIRAEAHRQALDWQVTFWSGEETEAERSAFQRWLSASAEHRAAWQRLERMSGTLRALPSSAASQALRTPKPRPTRRSVLRVLGLIAGTGAASYAVRRSEPWEVATADYRSGRGEQRTIALPDGTQVVLGTATAIDLHFNDIERRVLVRTGEILVTTARDPAAIPRPFFVETQQGSVQAIGTRFTVRQLDALSQVAVLEGAVDIRTTGKPDAPMRLDAGQQTRFRRDGIDPPVAVAPHADAWTRGQLVADRMRLDDFLAELGRYRSGIVRCDPAVGGQIVSGVYPLADTDRVLNSLAQALPIRVSYATGWWVSVGPR